MTDDRRRSIAKEWKRTLEREGVRKRVAVMLQEKHNVTMRTIYRWCRKFNISTN